MKTVRCAIAAVAVAMLCTATSFMSAQAFSAEGVVSPASYDVQSGKLQIYMQSYATTDITIADGDGAFHVTVVVVDRYDDETTKTYDVSYDTYINVDVDHYTLGGSGESFDGSITVTAKGAPVKLNMTNTDGYYNLLGGGDPFLKISNGATVNLNVPGDLMVKGGTAAIEVDNGATLNISGGGVLRATAASGAGIGAREGSGSGKINISGTITVVGTGGSGGAGIGGAGSASSSDVEAITIKDTAKVIATGGDGGAGIGSGDDGKRPDSITIMGAATVTATGGEYAAGIGGGNNTGGGTVNIESNTTVTATGGDYGAGIGSGDESQGGGGTVNITGATVTATGGKEAAGIGGGNNSNGGTVTITSSKVTAKCGGDYGAGIGSGDEADNGGTLTINSGVVTATGGNSAAGIGGGDESNGADVTINGGQVTATGGEDAAGIGGGDEGDGRSVTITGGTVKAVSGGGDSRGIGRGDYSFSETGNGSLKITGGSVLGTDGGDNESIGPTPTDGTNTLHRYVISLAGVADGANLSNMTLYKTDGTTLAASAYGKTDIYTLNSSLHSGAGTIYLYLPEEDPGIAYVALTNGSYYTNRAGTSTDKHVYATPKYTVHFDGNGGSDTVTGVPVDESFTYGVSQALTSAPNMTRSLYSFLGWSTSPSGTATYSNGQTVKNLVDFNVSETTLYAYWYKLPNVVLSYVSSDPDHATLNRSYEAFSAGAAPGTASGATVESVATGYHFVNWTVYDTNPTVVASTLRNLSSAQVDGITRSSGHYVEKTFVANIAANTYTIHFDANGGEGAPANETLKYDSASNLSISSAFRRVGYEFTGWTLNKDGTGTSYSYGQSVLNLATGEVGDTDVTLYAQWKQVPQATAVYKTALITSPDAISDNGKVVDISKLVDGSVAGSVSPTQELVDYMGKATTGSTATANTYYYLAAWITDDGTIVQNPSDYVTTDTYVPDFVDSSTAYTAVFMGNPYMVMLNDPSLSWLQGVVLMNYDAPMALPTAASLEMSKDGYTFVGWTDPNGKFYSDGQTVLNLMAPTSSSAMDNRFVLTPVWSANADVTMSYVSANVDAGSTTPASEAVAEATGTPVGSTAKAKDGYHFVNWTVDGTEVGTSAALTGEQVDAVAKVAGLRTATTFTANFTGNTYKVRFDKNAEDATGTMDVESGFTYGTGKTLTQNGYTRSGYAFMGWKVGTTERYVADGASVSDLTAEDGGTVTLYAQWEALPDAVLSYTSTDSAMGTVSNAFDVLTQGVTGTVNGSMATANTGYHFVNWTIYGTATEAGTGAELSKDQIDDTSAYVTDHYVTTPFRANFAANEYTVKFNANNGSGTMENQTLAYDTAEELDGNIYTYAGHSFIGWSTDKDATTAMYTDQQSVLNLTDEDGAELTLYAVWTADTNVQLSYASSNVAQGTVTPASEAVATDAAAKSAVGSTATAKTGFTFTGWTSGGNPVGTAEDATLSSTLVDDVARAGGSYQATTFTANFEASTFTVVFNANVTDSSVTGTMEDQTVTYGTATTLTSNAFKRTGYVFRGWEIGDTSKYLADQADVTKLTLDSSITLYAQWEALPDALISYTSSNVIMGAVNNAFDKLTRGVGHVKGATADAEPGYHFTNWTIYGTETEAGRAAKLDEDQLKTTSAYDTDHFVTTPFIANFAANTYTVEFDAGEGEGALPDETMTYGQPKNLTTADGIYRDNYEFAGWTTTQGGTTVNYEDGQKVLNLATGETDDTSVTLYAVWKLETKVAFTYTPDSPSHGTVTLAAEFIFAKSGVPTGSTATASPGYTFTNWTYKSASGETGIASSTVELSKQDVATAAKRAGYYKATAFTANFTGKTYSVVFDANAGNRGTASGVMGDQDMVYGTSEKLDGCDYTLSNYVFRGWATTADAATADYKDKQSVLNLATGETGKESVTLYAVWEPETQVTLSYVSESAAHGSVSSSSELVYEQSGTAAGSTATAGTGYEFSKWTYVDASGATKDAGTDVTLSPAQVAAAAKVSGYFKGTTFTATFTGKPYTVVFDDGVDDSSVSGTMGNQTLYYGTAEALSKNDYTRSGYWFRGWKVNSSTFLTDEAMVSDLATGETGDTSVTLTAVWEALPQATITYSVDAGGQGSASPVVEVVGGQTSEAPTGSTAQPELGYHFDDTSGWTYSDAAGTTKTISTTEAITAEQVTTVAKNADTGVYSSTNFLAHFAVNAYTVAFNANNGTGTMDSEDFTYDEDAKALTSNSFTRAGFTFAGWNTEPDGSGTDYADEAEVRNLTTENNGVVTLYAQWDGDPYTVTFNANGGAGTMASENLTNGTLGTLSANVFTRNCCVFNGWNTAADGSGTSYYDAQQVTTMQPEQGSSVTLYAQWTQTAPAVIAYASSNGGSVSLAQETIAANAPANPTGSTATASDGSTFVNWTYVDWMGVTRVASTDPTLTAAQVAAAAEIGGAYSTITFTANFNTPGSATDDETDGEAATSGNGASLPKSGDPLVALIPVLLLSCGLALSLIARGGSKRRGF